MRASRLLQQPGVYNVGRLNEFIRADGRLTTKLGIRETGRRGIAHARSSSGSLGKPPGARDAPGRRPRVARRHGVACATLLANCVPTGAFRIGVTTAVRTLVARSMTGEREKEGARKKKELRGKGGRREPLCNGLSEQPTFPSAG